DVEKEGITLLVNSLETLGDMYGIYGFSGYGRENVEFYTIKDIDERKLDQGIGTPHVIVVPNRVSPNQRDFSAIAAALNDVNAVLAPPISDLVVARGKASTFNGLSDLQGTRFHDEISRLGVFIVDYVISGELDRIYGGTS
ncbi:MAG: hypothetical protein VW499_06785, partial [Candidatus Puniceispirillum sp.]